MRSCRRLRRGSRLGGGWRVDVRSEQNRARLRPHGRGERGVCRIHRADRDVFDTPLARAARPAGPGRDAHPRTASPCQRRRSPAPYALRIGGTVAISWSNGIDEGVSCGRPGVCAGVRVWVEAGALMFVVRLSQNVALDLERDDRAGAGHRRWGDRLCACGGAWLVCGGLVCCGRGARPARRCAGGRAFQAVAVAARCWWSLSRLPARWMNAHSLWAAARPRRRKVRIPRLCLRSPKIGSIRQERCA